MANKKLTIHIGICKTGTSALQTFLSDNRALLNTHGVVYPVCPHGRRENHYLAWSLYKKFKRERKYPADLKSCEAEWESVLSQLNGEHNIISSEALAELCVDAVDNVKALTADFQTQIVIYLRRYDNWLNSFYNQRVKGTGACTVPEHAHILNAADTWSAVFSQASVIVRPYEKEQFYRGTIIDDFLLYAAGMESTEGFCMPPQNANVHLHRVVMEYKRMVNHLPVPSDRHNLLPAPVLRDLSEYFFRMAADRDCPVFSTEERLQMIERTAEKYATIAQVYLKRADRRLFYEPLPDPAENRPTYDVLTEADAREINRYLLEHYPKTVGDIQRGIRSGARSTDPKIRDAAALLIPGMPSGRMYIVNRIVRRLKPRPCYCRADAEKELVIHIGTHKTGTSALQQFFAANQAPLRERGIVYPHDADGGAEGGHYRLWWSLLAERGVADERYPKNLRSAAQEWRAVLGQFDTERMLISAEGLWNCTPEDQLKIKALTGNYRVKIVVYLRRQDTLTLSVRHQRIKSMACATEDDEKADYRMDYRQALASWSDVFGKDNILVRPYERGQFYQNSLFADFLHTVFGIELNETFYLPQGRINARLHRAAFAYKCLINRLPIPSGRLQQTLGPLLAVSESFYRQGREDVPLLSPQEQLENLRRYAVSNEAVARGYLGRADGQLFYDPPPESVGDWQPYELTAEDVRMIHDYLQVHYPEALCIILDGLMGAFSSDCQDQTEIPRRLLWGLVEPAGDAVFCRKALEQKRAELAGGCKGRRFQNWIRGAVPGPLKKPARLILRKFRRMARA